MRTIPGQMSKSVYFPNLDSLRTIAFLMVFFEHILWVAFSELNLPEGLLKHILYTMFCNGGAGVSVFFVISGFLITYLLLTEGEKSGKINIKAFYWRRVLRIWPLYLLLIIVVLHVLPLFYSLTHNPITNNANPAFYYFFISNFDLIRIHESGQMAFMQSSVTWSVSIEEQFYLIWPLLFFAVPKRFYLSIFLFFIILGVSFRAIYWQETTFIYFHTLGNCADLAIGGLAAWLSFYNKSFLKYFSNLRPLHIYSVYILGALFILLNDYYLLFPTHNVINRFLYTVFYAYVLLTQNFSTQMRFQLGKLKFLNWSGKYTYGLYLLHPMGYFIIKCFIDYFDISGRGFGYQIAIAIATLLVTYAIACTSYHLFEKRFLELKKRFTIVKSGV